MNLEEKLHALNEIGIALSCERNLNSLLEKILTNVRCFTNSEGASLYICEEDRLRFVISQNIILASSESAVECSFHSTTLPITKESISGYVAMSGEVLNIEDVYKIHDAPYSFNQKFDQENNYRSRSMLVVPIKKPTGGVLGVLALINARNLQNQIINFRQEYEHLTLSLASQAGVAIENLRLNEELQSAYLDTLTRLAIAAEYREPQIKNHLRRMSTYSAILADELGMSEKEVKDIRLASPMHDIGKIGVPDAILLKEGKLTPDEFEVMKLHTTHGAKILQKGVSEIIRLSEKIALTHHEKYDGSGYPNGLKGEEIPLEGRIVALADVYDALSSKRCYKEAWERQEVVEYICERAGTHFDPVVVDAFKRRLSDFFEVEKTKDYQTNVMVANPLKD